ncbi:hypothetical protein GOODEAATRI_027106 [Goodea atripinnis]|uniref:Uncharacterized protein n=1 Tax=Goodea atripinnis TaxID=208336 RepID=A0ABV0MVH8_9TELE
MVTHRGRTRGKVVLSRGPKHKPAKVSKTPQRAWKDSQRRTAVTRCRRTGVRRSTRRTRQTSRYQASNMFDGISNTVYGRAPLVLSARCEGGAPSCTLTSLSAPSSWGGGDTADVDSGLGTTADEDNNCSVNQDFNTRLGQGSSLYQGPSSEFLKGTFQINPSGTNTTCRRVFR